MAIKENQEEAERIYSAGVEGVRIYITYRESRLRAIKSPARRLLGCYMMGEEGWWKYSPLTTMRERDDAIDALAAALKESEPQ